jgi:hypothetical protein
MLDVMSEWIQKGITSQIATRTVWATMRRGLTCPRPMWQLLAQLQCVEVPMEARSKRNAKMTWMNAAKMLRDIYKTRNRRGCLAGSVGCTGAERSFLCVTCSQTLSVCSNSCSPRTRICKSTICVVYIWCCVFLGVKASRIHGPAINCLHITSV